MKQDHQSSNCPTCPAVLGNKTVSHHFILQLANRNYDDWELFQFFTDSFRLMDFYRSF